MDDFKPGDRVELVSTTDMHTNLVPGDQGTVRGYGLELGEPKLHVRWDNGSTLSLILVPGVDSARKVS